MPDTIHYKETEKFTGCIVHKAFSYQHIQEKSKRKFMTTSCADQKITDSFPVSAQSRAFQQETDTVVQQKPVYNFQGKTLLAVDDVSFNLTLVALFFKNTGAKLLFASDGRQALDICISNPEVDIILMDIQMPVMNGLEATKEIHKIKPGMPVIAITAFVHSDDKQRCFDAGCVEFLPKPCSRDDMLKTVNEFL